MHARTHGCRSMVRAAAMVAAAATAAVDVAQYRER